MDLHDLVQWWNLIFDLPFGFALLLTVLQTLGLLHLSHVHFHVGHHDLNMGHVGHIGHHAHVEHQIHVGSHGHASHDHGLNHAQANSNTGFGIRILSGLLGVLGLGKAPFMVVISTFFLIWGFTGLLFNQLFAVIFPPYIFIGMSVAIASFVSLLFTSLVSSLIGKYLPSSESFGSSLSDFAGRPGKAVTKITSKNGFVSILDKHLNRIEVKCRTDDDSEIPYGASVVPLYYEEEFERYIVCREEDFSLKLAQMSGSSKQNQLLEKGDE